MKTFFKILFFGLLVFLALTMTQEWEMFGSAWFGLELEKEKRVFVSAEGQEEARQTLKKFFSIMRHLYGSGGDRRFLERLPASEEVSNELMADIAYLQHNGRRQEHDLVRLDLVETEPVGEDAVEIITKEYWVIRVLWLDRPGLAEPVHSEILNGKYRLRRKGAGAWQVRSWEVIPPQDKEKPTNPT